MNEIIKIHDSKGQKVVSARELHFYLEVQSKFADWVKNRIEKYGFIENVDYTTFSKNLESGGKQIEYAITLDMAKELSMVENNEKGKEARKYFIAVDKKLRQIVAQPAIPTSFAEALRLAAAQQEEIDLKNKQLALQAPKVSFADRVIDSGNLVDIGQAAKLLKLPYGRNTFFKHLRDKGVFFKNRNEPKQEYIERGYFELRETEIPRENHPPMMVTKILVRQTGLFWLSKTFGGGFESSLPTLNPV